MGRPYYSLLLAALSILNTAGQTAGDTIVDVTTTLAGSPAVNQQGWRNSLGSARSNTEYLVADFPNPGNATNTLRGFLTFNLTSVSEPISAAELRLRYGDNLGPDPTELLGVFDVTTPLEMLDDGSGDDLSILTDLGSGVLYASTEVAIGSDPSTLLTINLNGDAVDAINSHLGGFFSVGLSFQTPKDYPIHRVMFGRTQAAATMRLTLVPEPAIATLLAIALAASVSCRRGR